MVMAGAVPAQATIFERGSFSFEESVEEDLCGIAVRRDSTANVKFRIRTGKGRVDQAFFGMDRYSYSNTFTNLATGAFFTVEGKAVFKDVGGNIFEFKVLEAGTPIVIRDMNGKVVMRDRG
ncbi:MAG TPA: hypothetical protein VEY49_04555, partial [Solirubrobacteraceae bacterium]|nr:hypothetical protein [Solirubrobacteraceae bacterium]